LFLVQKFFTYFFQFFSGIFDKIQFNHFLFQNKLIFFFHFFLHWNKQSISKAFFFFFIQLFFISLVHQKICHSFHTFFLEKQFKNCITKSSFSSFFFKLNFESFLENIIFFFWLKKNDSQEIIRHKKYEDFCNEIRGCQKEDLQKENVLKFILESALNIARHFTINNSPVVEFLNYFFERFCR